MKASERFGRSEPERDSCRPEQENEGLEGETPGEERTLPLRHRGWRGPVERFGGACTWKHASLASLSRSSLSGHQNLMPGTVY